VGIFSEPTSTNACQGNHQCAPTLPFGFQSAKETKQHPTENTNFFSKFDSLDPVDFVQRPRRQHPVEPKPPETDRFETAEEYELGNGAAYGGCVLQTVAGFLTRLNFLAIKLFYYLKNCKCFQRIKLLCEFF
jgi:hypothetical protein